MWFIVLNALFLMLLYWFERKKDMKKLTAILSLLLSLILLLTGCSTDTVSSSTEVTQTTESSLSTSGLQTIIGADSSVKVLNAYESLDYALNKLEGYIEQGIVEEDYMETLKVLSVALKDIETDLNADNASHIKDLMVTADDTVSSVMYMSDDSAYLDSLNDISATVSRIKESADRLISNTGTGGNKEDTNTSSDRVNEDSTVAEDTNNEGITTSNTTTMTPAEEDSEQTIDTSKVEQGDYTAGGYASTKADSKYKDNGVLTWSESHGLLFDTTQTKDLYNFVKSGYTSLRTVDARIQSRKGGADNPRIAWYESYELGKDNAFFTAFEDGDTGNTITVTYENINCSNTLLNMLKKPMKEDTDGDGVFETASKAWNDLIKRNDTEDVQKALCVTPENTSITYNFRNYCGDKLRVDIRGPNVNSHSAYLNIGDTEVEGRLAGVDYTLTCEEDPEAFKLISGDELKNYYSCETKWGISINEANTQTLVDAGLMKNRAAITKCSDYSSAGVTKPNSLGAGAQFYTGVKPGIYHCTITLKDGKQIPIVIENLPIHYEDKLWGGKSQSEIDACVKYVQQSRNMLYGQYIGLDGTNLLNRLMGGSTAAEDKINVADDTRENLSKAVKDFNNTNFHEFDGTRVELKDTEAAGEWWLHFTCVSPDGYFVWGGSHGTYRALELFTNDPNGDCETASAGMSCILNVMGYTTRYITNSSHAYIEIKVPAAITKSGKDQWIVMDNGVLCSGEPSTFGTRVTKGHTINFVNKGFNSYWVQDYPELLK